MDFWKSLLLKAPEIKPSSTPRAAPSRPNDNTANHSFQLKTSWGSSSCFSLKMFTGFLGPPAMSAKRGTGDATRQNRGRKKARERARHNRAKRSPCNGGGVPRIWGNDVMSSGTEHRGYNVRSVVCQEAVLGGPSAG